MHNVASLQVYAVIFIIVLQKEEEESNMDVAELADWTDKSSTPPWW